MKVVTANRFADGAVVWRNADDGWSVSMRDAIVLAPEDAERVLAAAQAEVDIVVAPYLVEVENGAPAGRSSLRESIRSSGPTVGNSLAANAKPQANV